MKQKHTKEEKVQKRKERRDPDARKKLKKDPGVPDLSHVKRRMIKNLEAKKRGKEFLEQFQSRRNADLEVRRGMDSVSQLEALHEKAEQELDDDSDASMSDAEMKEYEDRGVTHEGSRKAYYKEFRKIVETCDVVLIVLDARDPIGCRCKEVENMVERLSKRVILVLNKIDLVPRHNVEEWLKYLRAEQPTIAFKASLQEKKQKLKQSNISVDAASDKLVSTSECLGAENLIQLLKNYTRHNDKKTGITVGLVGYPNVGKSSVINSLKRSKVVDVGATPGLTKATKEIKLDKLITLMDCPGIVFAAGNDPDNALRNCLKIEKLDDPVKPIISIVQRCSHAVLQKTYSIGSFTDHVTFLAEVAKKRGKLMKGGTLDFESTARAILLDWNNGRIPFYTVPPMRTEAIGPATLVSDWAKEFDVDEVFQNEQKAVLDSLAENPEYDDVGAL